MKKNKLTKLFFVLSAVAALTLSAVSCNNILNESLNENLEKENAYLTINLAGAARTILPNLDVEKMQFTLYGILTDATTGLKGEKRTLGTFVDYKSLQTDIISLETGDWEFELEGEMIKEFVFPEGWTSGSINGQFYSTAGYPDGKVKIVGSLFTGKTTKKIVKGENKIAFELSLTADHSKKYGTMEMDSYYWDKAGNRHDLLSMISADSGTIDVTLNLPATSKVYVKASLYSVFKNDSSSYAGAKPMTLHEASNVKDEILTVKDNKVTFKKENVYYGYYDLIFDIYDDQEYQVKINTYKELVRVVSGCTSAAERTIKSLNTKFYNINYEIGLGSWKKGFVAPENFVTNQITKLPDATQLVRNDGYVLEGLYDNALFTGKTYTEITGIENNITLYPKWVKGVVLTKDTIDSFDIEAQSSPFTIVWSGEIPTVTDNMNMSSTKLRETLKKSPVYVDLIITDCSSLPNSVFSGCEKLRSVKLCEGITVISGSAFSSCTNLETLYLPSSVKTINNSSFSMCRNITNIYISDLSAYLNITSNYSSDNYVNLPFCESTKPCKIYLNNTELKTVVIPEDVFIIQKYAFSNCTGITSVTIPNTVTKMGSGAFRGCTSLEEITIPDSVTEIEQNAFNGCTKLKTVSLGSKVAKIGSYAFYTCTNLETLYIPSSLKTIEDDAFNNCSNISNLYISDLSAYLSINSNASTKTMLFPSTTKPRKIYLNNTELKTVVIPESISVIPNNAFNNCTGITSVTIPNTVTKLEHSTFKGCTSLEEITIPDSVTEIEGSSSSNGAFYGCTNLKTVRLGSKVSKIGAYAFKNCSNISNLYISDLSAYLSINNNASFGTVLLNGTSKPCKIYLNDSELKTVVIPENISVIPSRAFENCTGITSVTIPNTVTKIGIAAFKGCTSLEEITIPDSVTEIGGGPTADGAFSGCTNLKTLSFGNKVSKIGEYAFFGCSSLKDVTVPNSITSIDSYAFGNCSSLENLIIYNNSSTTINTTIVLGSSKVTVWFADTTNTLKVSINGTWKDLSKKPAN